MREIELTRGYVALVDDEDYDRVSQHRWYAKVDGNKVYAQGSISVNGKKTSHKMHRLVLEAPDGHMVDHIDGNGLNNQRSNLRLATNSQNQSNRSATTLNTSGFKGVSWHRLNKRWQATTKHNGRHIHLGYFDSAEDAAKAYDQKAVELRGEFAVLNFPEN